MRMKKKLNQTINTNEVLIEIKENKIFVYLRNADTQIWSIPTEFEYKKN